MTLKLNFMLFAAIAVMMTACDKNDEPLNRPQFEIEREAPVRALYVRLHFLPVMHNNTMVSQCGRQQLLTTAGSLVKLEITLTGKNIKMRLKPSRN